MDKKELAAKAVELLKKEYPDALCSLTYTKPHELLFATRLAAQCTDARVHIVAPVLYEKYPTIEALAEADEVARNHTTLVNQLIETVLTVGTRLTKINFACIEGKRSAVHGDTLAVGFHVDLLDVGRETEKGLGVGQ